MIKKSKIFNTYETENATLNSVQAAAMFNKKAQEDMEEIQEAQSDNEVDNNK